MDDVINKRLVINMIHKTIYGFFDVVEDNSEEPMSEKDKLLLAVNKAICNGIKELPSAQSEIILCKDCRNNHWCNIQEAAMAGDNFFCGAAERREE